MFNLRASTIPGCFEVLPRVLEDARGRFIKVFHRQIFTDLRLETQFAEEYYTVSRWGVIRGMHFQLPPVDHVKLVYCADGTVFDVVVDLRVGSPTYGQYASFELSAEKANYVYIPKGLAHGFCTISEKATLIYKVSTVHSPEHDSGILWNSVGVTWPADTPIISDRDRQFPSLADFLSPFRYDN